MFHRPILFLTVFSLAAAVSAQDTENPSQNSNEFLSNWARNVLTEGASDKDPETRREVAVALSLNSSRDAAFYILESLLKDQDYLCREAAITTIGEMGDPDLAGLVRPALEDGVAEVMFAAARALYRLGDPDGKEALSDIFAKEEKAESGFFRGRLRDTMRRLKTPKSALLFAAEQGVSFVPVPGLGEGYSAMTSMLTDADFSPRAASLMMLSSDRSGDVREMVEEAFVDDDWSVKAAAIQITAAWNESGWRTYLIPLFQDSNKKVRFRAAAVYLRLNHSGGNAEAK